MTLWNRASWYRAYSGNMAKPAGVAGEVLLGGSFLEDDASPFCWVLLWDTRFKKSLRASSLVLGMGMGRTSLVTSATLAAAFCALTLLGEKPVVFLSSLLLLGSFLKALMILAGSFLGVAHPSSWLGLLIRSCCSLFFILTSYWLMLITLTRACGE